MTTLFARPPLQELSMSKAQSGSRRQSSRLQEREDSVPPSTSVASKTTISSAQTTKAKAKTSTNNSQKRKAQYDEEDDGFKFSRVKRRKASPQLPAVTENPAISKSNATNEGQDGTSQPTASENGVSTSPKQPKKKRMSFSTPTKKDSQSKRLSSELEPRNGSPPPPPALLEVKPVKLRKEKTTKHKSPAERGLSPQHEALPSEQTSTSSETQEHAPTKIALPFADTPVISRNKAMRQDRASKGERRSSLGLRGRRASSLIDSGTSNGEQRYSRTMSNLTLSSSATYRNTARRVLQTH